MPDQASDKRITEASIQELIDEILSRSEAALFALDGIPGCDAMLTGFKGHASRVSYLGSILDILAKREVKRALQLRRHRPDEPTA